jgi:phage tail-like protein
MAETDSRTVPFCSYNFAVEIDGLAVAAFSEVSGLTAEGDPVDYREGTDPVNNVRKLIGLRKYSNIMFKRGYTQNSTLWDWYKRIAEGQPDRRNGSVVLMNEAHRPVMRWNFDNAWINKIEGPGLNASNNEVAIENMELCHEGLSFELETAGA